MAELNKEITALKKRDEELGFRAAKAEEYLQNFKPLDEKKANELKEKLDKLNISRLKPEMTVKIIDLLEATARGWNRNPTPFVWGGKRAARRERSRRRRHALGGSGACTRRPVRRRRTKVEKWLSAKQVTH